MTQQLTDVALAIKTLIFDNWGLEDNLSKNEIEWFSYKPTSTEIRQKPITISVEYQSGTGSTTCKAVDQIKDLVKIDVWYAMRNLEGAKPREIAESNRILMKDQIVQIIKSNQTSLSGVKFSKTIRSARADEVESDNEQWYLHETLFIQAEWYLTS